MRCLLPGLRRLASLGAFLGISTYKATSPPCGLHTISSSTCADSMTMDVSGKTFDYVICGGGTAGLTLAARLSSDPAISVLVLEAGPANLDDPAILIPAQLGVHIGNPEYDWCFWTEDQKYCNGKRYLWTRGKLLGGSSTVNFLAYGRPPAVDINAWEELGNPGWTWERFLSASKRGEKFTLPSLEQESKFRQTFDGDFHGTQGELAVSFPAVIMSGEIPFQDTINNLGIKTVHDHTGGDINGTWIGPGTVDPRTHTRSSAATAFYLPYATRPNLTVLTLAHVNRILSNYDPGVPTESSLTAEAVEFSHEGKLCTAEVAKEVILCAGAIKSPQLLELSGIGSVEILRPLGIHCFVDLPGVGENTQEHCFVGVSFELNDSQQWNTLDLLTDDAFAAEQKKLHAKQEGLYRLGLGGFTYVPLSQISPAAQALISAQGAKLKRAYDEGRIGEGLWEQYKLQLRNLQDSSGVDCEILPFPKFLTYKSPPEKGKVYVTVLCFLNHPFTRGSIHITSTDPEKHPGIDPRYFEDDFDLQILVEQVKFARRLKEVEPFKSMIVKEVDPGADVQTDDDIREYIKSGLTTTFHTAGTTSMLPRSSMGVVDPSLKVYGTRNVRVVDLGIVPLHVAAHTQATVYAIAEQAADIIRAERDACGGRDASVMGNKN